MAEDFPSSAWVHTAGMLSSSRQVVAASCHAFKNPQLMLASILEVWRHMVLANMNPSEETAKMNLKGST